MCRKPDSECDFPGAGGKERLYACELEIFFLRTGDPSCSASAQPGKSRSSTTSRERFPPSSMPFACDLAIVFNFRLKFRGQDSTSVTIDSICLASWISFPCEDLQIGKTRHCLILDAPHFFGAHSYCIYVSRTKGKAPKESTIPIRITQLHSNHMHGHASTHTSGQCKGKGLKQLQ